MICDNLCLWNHDCRRKKGRGAILINQKGHLFHVCKSALEVLGYEMNEVKGRAFTCLFDLSAAPFRLYQILKKRIKGKVGPKYYIMLLRKKNGDHIPVVGRGKLVELNGKNYSMFSFMVIRDDHLKNHPLLLKQGYFMKG